MRYLILKNINMVESLAQSQFQGVDIAKHLPTRATEAKKLFSTRKWAEDC